MAIGVCCICGGHTGAGRVSPRIHYCLPCNRFAVSVAVRAGNRVRYEVAAGRIPSLRKNHISCVDCGARAVEYDHRDYSKPLDVEPVCRKCNDARGPASYVGTAADPDIRGKA